MPVLGWRSAALWIGLGVLVGVAVSLAYGWLAFAGLGEAAMDRAVVGAVLLPTLLGGPLLGYLAAKLRELAKANDLVGVLAATDGLTACLNRGTFSACIDQWIKAGNLDHAPGAMLLVIDADRFRAINDEFGYDEGDEALRLIAQAIRNSVRSGDLVGRLCGAQLGVFLPGATSINTIDIAERIRTAIGETAFRPHGRLHQLTVSIGGVAIDGRTASGDLYRQADRRLYEAKKAGRDRIAIQAETPRAAPQAVGPLH